MTGDKRTVLPPKTVEELRRRYLLGERHFDGMRLPHSELVAIELSAANLEGANLEGANLEGADLQDADLQGADLQDADLQDADFQGADLQGANLQGANLQGANLQGANLQGANLEGANLQGANLQGANLQSANLERADLSEGLECTRLEGANLGLAVLEGANLQGANLLGAELYGANLQGVNLQGANLGRAVLEGANLQGANLQNTKLHRANLSYASLEGADLQRAHLPNANLSNANLTHADLTHADLSNANLDGATLLMAVLYYAHITGAVCANVVLGHTLLIRTDLSPLCDALPTIDLMGPCTVDHESILLSIRSPSLKSFIQKAGIPEVFAEYMYSCAKSLTTDVFRMLQSTFISFGGPDEPFARKLYEALHRNGVTTFFFPEHAVPGDKLHRMMRKGVNEHDRVVLICSKASLDRKGVMNEIEETLAREARDGGAAYLIPLRLDNYIFSGWNPPPEKADVAQAVRDRVVADFEGADTDQAKFDAAFLKLIRALKK